MDYFMLLVVSVATALNKKVDIYGTNKAFLIYFRHKKRMTVDRLGKT